MEKNIEKRYDIIIAGTGAAGCFAALHLPENKKILMITKGKLEESDSFLAQGGICVQRDDDDFESFMEDTLRAGHYKNKKESVEIMIHSSREVIEKLISFGVDFAKENGELVYTREAAHSKSRILYHDDITGQEITEKLLSVVQKRKNITVFTETTMVDILCRENRCGGIIVRDKKGEIFSVYADDIILATGGVGGVYSHSTNFPHLTGDSLALAVKHNIKVKDTGYVQIHPTSLYSEKTGRKFLVSESVRGEGALLYDKNFKRFTNELIPRDRLTEKIYKQMEKDGTSHVWLDMRAITEKGIDIKKRFPNIVKRCIEEGYNPEKECIPVVPAQHYFMGGIDVDLNSMTSMENLYAVGETSCNGVHGANRLASNSLLESLVFAEKAAQHIVVKSKNEKNFREFEETEIDFEKYKDKGKLSAEYKAIVLAEIEKDKKLKEKENE